VFSKKQGRGKMKKKRFYILVFIFVAVISYKVFGYELPWKMSADAGKETTVLLVSDIHFDPFVDGAAKELEKTPVNGWQAVLENHKLEEFPAYKEDTNYRLLVSAINKIKEVSSGAGCAIIGGDLLCHKFEIKYKLNCSVTGSPVHLEIKTIEFIALMLKKAMRGKPVYFVMGNNDSDNGDYNTIPNGGMLKDLPGYFNTVRSDRQAARDFRKGGYYEVPFSGLENTEIIVLNDTFWHKKFKKPKSMKYNPGRIEMQWLVSELDAAAKKRNKVIIAMHIPPGIDSYLAAKDKKCKGNDGFLAPEYNKEFLEIMRTHSAVVQNTFAGHTHFDDFRVFSDAGRPFLQACIIPSICPAHGNNPAFELALLTSAGVLKDRAVYYLSGFGGNDADTRAKWALEYTFDRAFGYSDCSPASLYALAASMKTNPVVLDKYMSFFTVSNPIVTMLFKQQSRIYECALTSRDFGEYAACGCGPVKTSHPSTAAQDSNSKVKSQK
jgi:sphingomyelin phosphodiesterase acid-like 3